MQEISYRDLINKEELQRLQDEFCAATGVLMYCLDERGEELTRVSGDFAEEIVQQYTAGGYIRDVLERVEEGSLEDLAIQEAESLGGDVAAVAVRVENATVLYWVVIRTESAGSPVELEDILDLLRDAGCTLIENKVECFTAEMESEKSITAKEEIDRDLKSIEATTEILQLLDSDEPVERIMAQLLRVLGTHLDADTAQIFQLRWEEQVMDVLSEWLAGGFASHFEKANGIETEEFLKASKPLVLTLDGSAGEYHSDLVRLGLQAVMIFPILHQDNTAVVLALNCRTRRPLWGMQEVKFASDVVRILQSILTRRIQKNSIVSARLALEAILDNVGTAIYVTDQESGERIFANDKLQRQFVMELQDGSFPGLLQTAMDTTMADGTHELYHADVEFWYNVVYREIVWIDGRLANLYLLRDITAEKEYQKKLALQAHTDHLTGLYNRTYFEEVLTKAVEEARRTQRSGALLYLNLDDFKRINDGLGHQYGDEVLRSVADSLQKIEGIQKTCYRMSGDEFAIIVPAKYFSRLDRIRNEVRRIFSMPWYLKDSYYYCTISMGIVIFPDDGSTVQELMKKVDLAIYDAKKAGKNQVVTYEKGVESSSGRRWEMEQDMRASIADNFAGFQVVYQPIMNIEGVGNNCVAAEALLRWQSDKLGEVELAEFLPLAEYLGLINAIGNFVLHQACVDCKSWNDLGYPDFKVSVDLSLEQLQQTDIAEIIEETLKATGVTPENLILDVKEDLAVSDMERMKDTLGRIRALGVLVALDDFGTGVSSMKHVRELPFDLIKVGQDFTGELAKDEYVQAFVQMTDRVGRALGARVCVEGIETKEQYDTVKELQVEYAQGFYLGKPTGKEEFTEKYVESVDFL